MSEPKKIEIIAEDDDASETSSFIPRFEVDGSYRLSVDMRQQLRTEKVSLRGTFQDLKKQQMAPTALALSIAQFSRIQVMNLQVKYA